MKDEEIKEILNRLEKIGYYASVPKELAYMPTNITPQECKTILDYITNLQQENERLKLEIERLNDVLVHKPDEKITLKTQDGKEMFIIQSERIDMQEELNKANMQLMTQLEDYKSRCKKAVEYINYCDDLSVINDYSFNEKPVIEKRAKKDLLNTLNGKE